LLPGVRAGFRRNHVSIFEIVVSFFVLQPFFVFPTKGSAFSPLLLQFFCARQPHFAAESVFVVTFEILIFWHFFIFSLPTSRSGWVFWLLPSDNPQTQPPLAFGGPFGFFPYFLFLFSFPLLFPNFRSRRSSMHISSSVCLRDTTVIRRPAILYGTTAPVLFPSFLFRHFSTLPSFQ